MRYLQCIRWILALLAAVLPLAGEAALQDWYGVWTYTDTCTSFVNNVTSQGCEAYSPAACTVTIVPGDATQASATVSCPGEADSVFAVTSSGMYWSSAFTAGGDTATCTENFLGTVQGNTATGTWTAACQSTSAGVYANGTGTWTMTRAGGAAAVSVLSVSKSGTGSGTVSSSPAGINCGSSCSASLSGGASVTLTATPASGSTFAGWSGACTGTGDCKVTMDTAKSVTASFNAAPFAVMASVNVTPTSATISTRITFNPTDLGKPGAVFVTAWVPVGSLGALGISTVLNSQVIVTSTSSLRRLGLEVTREALAAVESGSFVLVQLSSSGGWQLVSSGQLVPYANGVLGDNLAAQSILNNTNPANLGGSQFCLGYGSDASDMIASGRIQLVATIPGGSSAAGTGAGSCLVQTGGVMTSFGTRGSVSAATTMYGSFALANTTEIYLAVRGQSLKTLGFTQNPLDMPNLRVYDAAGKDALGSTAAGCTAGSTVSNYYASAGGALDARDTCLSATLAAGVYTFTINPNTSSASGELLFEVKVNPASSASPGGMMTSFGTRGTITPAAPMYGGFAVGNSSVMYIAVRGQSLKTLGFTQNPLDLPNIRVYDASGRDVLQNASGGVTVSGCPATATINNYYATVRGGALNANDTCVSSSLAAGVYTFTLNPNTPSSTGEVLFEVTVNP